MRKKASHEDSRMAFLGSRSQYVDLESFQTVLVLATHPLCDTAARKLVRLQPLIALSNAERSVSLVAQLDAQGSARVHEAALLVTLPLLLRIARGRDIRATLRGRQLCFAGSVQT